MIADKIMTVYMIADKIVTVLYDSRQNRRMIWLIY